MPGKIDQDAINENGQAQRDIDFQGEHSITNLSTLSADNVIYSGEYGVRWDQSNSSPELTRTKSSYGLSVAKRSTSYGHIIDSPFDRIWPWAGMRRCNLADDGTVNAYYGDDDYAEDGSNGQVMVEIPRFYYYSNNNGTDYDFAISPLNKSGYSVHPGFVRGGEVKDYTYVGAYKATVYDDSASAYVGDGITFDYANDIMASVAGFQPISGDTDHFDIEETRQLANNRGTGWAQNDFFNVTAWQLLAVIEYASFNFQSVLSEGITNLDSGTGNHSQNTGHTSSLGNASGEVVIAEGDLENGATGGDTQACSYRGIENPFGNICNFTDGIFIKDDGYYIESDPANWNSDGSGYTHIPTTPINSNGYIDDIDYLTELDYQFFASSTGGSTSTYLCDYQYGHDSGEVNILISGGAWAYGSGAGLFYLYSNYNVGASVRDLGARLEFIG